MPSLAEPDSSARQRLHARRGRAEAILDLARSLPPRDRALVEQVFARGSSLAEVARIAGVPPRVMQRRLRILMLRLRDPHFVLLATRPELFPFSARRSGQLFHFRGLSLRQVARRRRKSLHAVRDHLNVVHTLAQQGISNTGWRMLDRSARSLFAPPAPHRR